MIAFRELPDHFPYDRAAVESLIAWSDSMDAPHTLVCTQKDLVKLQVSKLGERALWALEIAMEILRGEDELEALLERLAGDALGGGTASEERGEHGFRR